MITTPFARPQGFTGSFETDLATRSAYSEGAGPYRIVPAAVAVPRHTDDLQRLVTAARAAGVGLVPRGAGSAVPGNNIGPGVVVDFAKFDRPLAVSVRRTANAGAAVTWRDLDRAAAMLHLRLPPDPSSGAFCTLGGMASTNAAGPSSLRYGSIRRWIRGIELVTADGERGWLERHGARRPNRRAGSGQRTSLSPHLSAVQRFEERARPAIEARGQRISNAFPRTSKNAAGYALDQFLATGDLIDLLIGSEGTLGFITRLELDLDTRPKHASSVLLALGDLAALSGVVASVLTLDPSAVELLDRTLLRFAELPDLPLDGVEAILLVDFEGSREATVRDAVQQAVNLAGTTALYSRAATTESERSALWEVRHAASPTLAGLPRTRRSMQIIEDGCVPIDRLGEYLRAVREAAERCGIEIVAFGHAGDGHLHVNALVDTMQPDFVDRLTTLLHDTTEIVLRLGGTVSGEHGDGRLRGPLLERLYGADIVRLFGAVKTAFDPDGLLNPGVVVGPFDGHPLERLKLGTRAEAIPDHVAQALYRVERGAGWGTSKRRLIATKRPSAGSGR